MSADDALATMLGHASAGDLTAACADLPIVSPSCLLELMESYLMLGRIVGHEAELVDARGRTVDVFLDGRLVTTKSGTAVIELRIERIGAATEDEASMDDVPCPAVVRRHPARRRRSGAS